MKSQTETQQRTYVYKDQKHRWFANVPSSIDDRRRIARKAIETALVARGIIEPGQKVEVDAYLDGRVVQFRTVAVFPPKRIQSRRGVTNRYGIAVGDHVICLHRHGMRSVYGNVVLVTELLRDGNVRVEGVGQGGFGTWTMRPQTVERTTAPLTER